MRKYLAILAFVLAACGGGSTGPALAEDPVPPQTVFDITPGRCGDGADGSCFVYMTDTEAWYLNWFVGSSFLPNTPPSVKLQRYNVYLVDGQPIGLEKNGEQFVAENVLVDGAVNAVLVDPSGATVTLVMNTTRESTRTRSGRGQTTHKWLVIQNGTLTTN